MQFADIVFTWRTDIADGAMVPLARFAMDCEKQFVNGHRYRLAEIEHASDKSRRFYFASIDEAWSNLPESMLGRWPTPTHLRRWALIQAGFCNQRVYACANREEALRLAPFVATMDFYAVVIPKDDVVMVFTAQSQRRSNMKKKVFQESSQKVLEIVWNLVGLTPEEAAPHVARAA